MYIEYTYYNYIKNLNIRYRLVMNILDHLIPMS